MPNDFMSNDLMVSLTLAVLAMTAMVILDAMTAIVTRYLAANTHTVNDQL